MNKPVRMSRGDSLTVETLQTKARLAIREAQKAINSRRPDENRKQHRARLRRERRP